MQYSKIDTENDRKVFTLNSSEMVCAVCWWCLMRLSCLKSFFRPLVNWLLQCMYKCMIFAYECEDWLRFVACKIEATKNWMVENFTFQSTINRFSTIYPECSHFDCRSPSFTWNVHCIRFVRPNSYCEQSTYGSCDIHSNMLPFKHQQCTCFAFQ